ncbi:MAG: NAD(+)/NADH kinase [Porcipelethomonas sp.]
MNTAVFPNFQKKNALRCAREVCDILHEIGVNVFVDEKYYKEFSDKNFVKFGKFSEFIMSSEVIIAIGGDGTILRCAKQIVESGSSGRLLGINTGHLGFMAALEYGHLDLLKNLSKEDYSVVDRMMLEAEICDGSGRKFTALNDITISGMYSRICEFKVYSNESCIGKYRADGVIFGTPTGSTAYSLSAGGPIIDPEMECIEMALICPHSLFARPMVISAEKKITFVQTVKTDSDVYVCVDGDEPIKLKKDVKVTIRRSEHKVRLIDMTGDLFYNALNNKLMQPIK